MCTEKPIEELMINAKCKSSADYEKQMKIVEAVNASKCIPAAGSTLRGKTHVSIPTSNNSIFSEGDIYFTDKINNNNYCWDMICTIEEYFNCIEEMKYHYDIPKWCSYNRADKEPLTVENSDYSFYGKETFVYGQVVYAKDTHFSNELIKFGCLTLDGNSAILLVDAGHMVYPIAGISSKPFKSKEDIEIEKAKKEQVEAISRSYMLPQHLALRMQENGHLAEIILPLEKK